MPAILPWIERQINDAAGVPLVGAKIYPYAANTLVPKATYVDAGGLTPNTHPIVTDAAGRFKCFLAAGSYDFVVHNAAGVLQYTLEDISGGGAGVDGSFATVTNIAALKALSGGAFDAVDVLGYYAAGDGGGGRFYWDSASAATQNGGTVITPDSLPAAGRWRRILTANRHDVREFGAKGDNTTDDTAAIQACLTAAGVYAPGAGGSSYVWVPQGTYLCSGTLTFPSRCVTMEGATADFTQLRHAPASFSNFIEIDSAGEGWIQIRNLTLKGSAYRLGKTAYLIYAVSMTEGSVIEQVNLRDAVGMIKIESGYLSKIDVRCQASTWNAVGEAGVSQPDWETIHGPDCAPIWFGSMNACEISVKTYRIGSIVTGGITSFACMLIRAAAGSSFKACNFEWGLEDYDAFVEVNSYALRVQNAIHLYGVVADFAGVNMESMRANCLIYCKGENAVRIGALNDYQNYSTGDRFVNQSGHDQIVDNYRATDVRAAGVLFKFTASGISDQQGWLVRASSVTYGKRVKQTIANGGPNDDPENVVDTYSFTGTEKLGMADGVDRTYSASRQFTPKRLTGLVVTAGSLTNTGGSQYTAPNNVAGSIGHFLNITPGVYMREDGQIVDNKRGTAEWEDSGNQVAHRLRPITASRYYRLFIGCVGNLYLVESATAFTDDRGNWIAQFRTNASTEIVRYSDGVTAGLDADPYNPRMAYYGAYIPNQANVVVMGTAAPSSGLWSVGDFIQNSAPSAAAPFGWVCIDAAGSGTWQTVEDPTFIKLAKSVNGAWEAQQFVNEYAVAASTAEIIRHHYRFRGGGSSSNRTGGYVEVRKIGDFGSTPAMDSRIVLMPASDEVPYDALDISQEGIKQYQPNLGTMVSSLRSAATNDDPEEKAVQNRVATTDATVTTIHSFAIPTDTVMMIKAMVQARQTGGSGTTGHGASYEVTATYRNIAGTVTLIGSVAKTAAEDNAGWDCDFSISTTNAALRVTGEAAKNITWHMTARTYQVGT